MTIKNIIFDLGGVILNIDYNLTISAFRDLGVSDFNKIYNQNNQDSLFDDFDTGKISSGTFRKKLASRLNIIVNDKKFDEAWNAMLLDLPLKRLEFIKSLRKKYKIYLFSNINEIHLKKVFEICQEQNGINTFNGYFDQEYYSNLFGRRKPNKESFLAILNENQIFPSETLFVDDSSQHILGAQAVGLQVFHLSSEKSIFDLEALLKIKQTKHAVFYP